MSKKNALIFGAGNELGVATAIRLANNYAGLMLITHNSDEHADAVEKIKTAELDAMIIAADFSLPENAEKVISEAHEKFGGMDAVIIVIRAAAHNNGSDIFAENIEGESGVQLSDARWLSVLAWPMLEKAKGSIVFVSANSIETIAPEFVDLTAINEEIRTLVKEFAERGKSAGIRVNGILAGGLMMTRRINSSKKGNDESKSPLSDANEKVQEGLKSIRYPKSDQIAEMISILLAEDARSMTGLAIKMEGDK
jgi:NAD(P)-dependent dehydrogenase (short-subunit alcohol dehydrogenase family)